MTVLEAIKEVLRFIESLAWATLFVAAIVSRIRHGRWFWQEPKP